MADTDINKPHAQKTDSVVQPQQATKTDVNAATVTGTAENLIGRM
ncbi:MAG: hypothetical protein PHN35_00720 [Clostridia bacterium]|nr:hypothetical protein [Clostridia bacterium]